MLRGTVQTALFSIIKSINLQMQGIDNYKLLCYCIFFIVLFIQMMIIIVLYKFITKRKATINVLNKNVEKYQTIFQSMREGFVLFEVIPTQDGGQADYYVMDANQAFESITGFGREKFINKSINDLLPETQIDVIIMLNRVAETGEFIKDEIFIKWLNKYLLVNIYKPEQDKLAVMFSDITQKKLAEELVQRQNLSFEALFKNSSDAIVRFNQYHEVLDINERFTTLFGYTIDEIRGMEVDSVVAPKENSVEANKITSDLFEGHEVSLESVRFDSKGKPKDVSIKGVPIILNNEIIGGYGIYADISLRKKAEKEILYMSYHDQLTDIYNRRFFEEELKRLDTERNLPISVIMADVNGLKLYNDVFGHAAGDKLLIKTAELIKMECRDDEIIARLGGDEFVILLPKTNSEEAKEVIRRIKASSSRVQLKSAELSISFGWETKISIIQDINEILKNAEDYMYRNKLYESPSIRGRTIQAIINSLHEKNKREEQHSQRVSSLCEAIGIAMGISENALNELKTVGLLHDIGKIAIDEKILNKPGRLTKLEWNEIKRHPEIGYRILSSVSDMTELAKFVLAHHERWDGKGYPKGLKGEETPLQARIITVADAYDAMTGERAYCKPLTEDMAIEELVKNAGTQFDAEIVKIFIKKVMKKKCI